MADYAITPEFLKSYRDWQNQRQATTGIAPRPEDFQALAEANLATQAGNRYRDRELQLRQEGIQIQKDAISAQKGAAAISGVTGLVTSGAMTYGVGKSLGYWGGAAAGAETAGGVGAASDAAGMVGFGTVEAGGAGEAAIATEGAVAGGSGASGIGVAVPAVGAAIAGIYGPGYLKRAGMNDVWAKGLIRGPESFLGSAAEHIGGKTAGWIIDPVGHIGDAIANATGTVICTELHRQGIINERQRRYGRMYGARIGDDAYIGYLLSAAPIVERMKKSKSYTRFVAFFAVPAIKEMAHRVNPRNHGSILGSLVLHFGLKHCIKAYDSLPEEIHDGIPC